MSALLDILTLLIIIIPIIVGATRGFVKSISRIVSLVLAILVAVNFSSNLYDIVDKKGLKDKFEDKISQTVLNLTKSDEQVLTDIENENSNLYTFLDNIGLDLEQLKAEFNTTANRKINELVDSVSAYLANKCTAFLCFIVLFLATYIIALVLFWLISKFAKIPILKHCDKALGTVMGIVFSLLALFVFTGIFNSVKPILHSAYPQAFPVDIADKTLIYKFVSDLMIFIKNLLF